MVDRNIDILKQGFMKIGRGKKTKPTRPIIACDKCKNWHQKGKHIPSMEGKE